MGEFLETIYDVLFKPKAAMQQIAEKKLTGQALAMFLLAMLVPVWAVYAGIKDIPSMPLAGSLFILQVFGSLFCWVIGAAVLNFAAEAAGGRGTALGLFAALGFTHLPRVVVIPLGVLAALLPDSISGLAFGMIGLLVAGWSLFLSVAAVAGAHRLSVAKAVLVLLAPLLALLGIGLAAVVFLGSALLQLPFQL